MQNNNLVSIGISFYNAEKYLAFAIQSVLAQTHTDWELLLVDDGSVDESLSVAKSFVDPRIKIIADGINKGLIFRLNQLIENSNGAYFVRMDADDIMFPERIDKQLTVFEKNSGIDLVHTDAISINNKNIILGYKKSTPQKFKEDILNGKIPIHPTVMARISFYNQNKYENEFAQMEDYELWFRTIESSTFFNLNEPCLFYREESTAISKKHFRMIPGKLNFAKKYNLDSKNTFHSLFKARMKGIIYLVLEKFKLQNLLLSKRYDLLSENEEFRFESILDKVLKENE